MRCRITRVNKTKLAWRVYDGEGALIDLGSRTIHTLNRTATFLWERAAVGMSDDDLTLALCQTFAVDEGVARGDVQGFLQTLTGLGIMETSTDHAEVP